MRRTYDTEMLAALVVAFILGALFSLLAIASAWLYTAPVVGRTKAPTRLPEVSGRVVHAEDAPAGPRVFCRL